MERNQRNLETYTTDEKHQGSQLYPIGGIHHGSHIIKIERATGAIEQRDAIEQQSAREEGCKDILGSSLSRLLIFLGKSYQGCHRDRRQFQSNEEHQEVA